MLTVRLKKMYWNMFGVVVRFHWSFPPIMFFHLICDFCKISLRGIFQTAERVSIRVLITRSFSVLSRAISLFEVLATLTRVYRSLHAVCSRTPFTQPFENGKRYEENLVKISKNKTIESEAFSKSERERERSILIAYRFSSSTIIEKICFPFRNFPFSLFTIHFLLNYTTFQVIWRVLIH